MTSSTDPARRLIENQSEFKTHETPANVEYTPRPLLPRIRIDVFAVTDGLIETVELAMSDRMARRAEASMFKGDITTAIAHYQERLPASLIVIEHVKSAGDIKKHLNALADLCSPSTRLLLIGSQNDVVLYRDLIRMGVGDYLVLPVSPLEILDAISNLLDDNAAQENLGHVLAFIGARGGVGASTLSHNVAHCLATDFAATTLLIDTDVGFGTAAMQFDTAPPRTLAEALREGELLNAEVLEGLVDWRDKRFGLLAAPPIPEGTTQPTATEMRQVIDQARRIAQYVVLDLPANWQPHVVEALTVADRIAIVATPDFPGLHNLRMLSLKLAKMRPNDPPPDFILNKLPQKKKTAVSPSDFERVLNRKLAAMVPDDPIALSASEMDGVILALHRPTSQVVPAIRELTAMMSGRPSKEQASKSPKNNILSRILRRRG